jgi:DNA-binding CsgD family transcriptional regulator
MRKVSRKRRKERKQRKELIETYLSEHPDATLEQIGSFLGVSKQRAHVLLKVLGIATRKQRWRQFPTVRQTEILRYIASGYTNEQIAATFGLSKWTIKRYVSTILAKLKANNRVEAVKLARQQGLI